MPYSVLSDDISTVSHFTRRKKITITTGGTSTPEYYQVKFTITYEPGMQADFDDIRFNTKAGVYIDYWIEDYIASTTATVWVELPDAIINPESDYIYMYYGNPSLSNGGDAGDTFIFGDDFTGGSVDTSKWDITGTVVIDTNRLKITGNDNWNENGVLTDNTFARPFILNVKIAINPTGTGDIFCGYSPSFDISAGINYYAQNTAMYVWQSVARATFTNFPSADIYYQFESQHYSTNTNIYNFRNATGTLIETESYSYAIDNAKIQINAYRADDYFVDWVYIRKYIANEPTLSYGNPQHQRITPQFIG